MRLLFLFFLFFPLHAFEQNDRGNSWMIQKQVWAITEVMFHDVVNPPAAARFYAYSLLTGYEVNYYARSNTPDLKLKLQGVAGINQIARPSRINADLATLYGILETAKNIIPSGYLLEEKQKDLLRAFKHLDKELADSSCSYARAVARFVVQYAKSDGYFKLSTFKRYKPHEGEGYWKPTPPEYLPPVEPYWNSIRTFFLDSADQCTLKDLVSPYSKDTNSTFFQLCKEVYSVRNKLTTEQKWIADFWDCNPFAVQYQGHMSIGLKKISPGGHWMNITGLACKKAGLDFGRALFLQTIIALTIHDAFVTCWYEKYATNRIRPETAINKIIDERWRPYLQTPPFPEYPSGHSVISTAAAKILTAFLGPAFSFVDSTEQYIGIPARRFQSFNDAAAEARISRLYGGIHFRDAIVNGETEGNKVAEIIISKLKQ